MPVVWPTLLDLSRDECKRILRKLGTVRCNLWVCMFALLRRACLFSFLFSMSGPNSSSEWSIEGRRLVPLMPRLVPQTAFTVTANAVANAAVQHNASLPVPAETGNKEVVVCYSYTSTTSTPTSTLVPSISVATVKSPGLTSSASNIVLLSGSTVCVSCSDDDEKPRKRRRTNSSSSSPVLLKEVPKAVTPVTKTITVPVSGSPKMSNIMQSIANSLPPHMSPVKITFTKPSTQTTNTTTQKVCGGSCQMFGWESNADLTATAPNATGPAAAASAAATAAATSAAATTAAAAAAAACTVFCSSTAAPAIAVSTCNLSPFLGVKIITQQVQLSKILPKPVTAALPSSSNSPIMVVSSNGTVMTTKLVTTPSGTQATYTRPTVSPSIGARMAGTPGAATYVKTTSGSIITVVPKSLATLGGKIISSNIVSGRHMSCFCLFVLYILGLNSQGEKTVQAVPAGAKPAIITATRPITKMIVTQPKGIGSTVQPATKIIPTKIVYGQQGKTQVLIKPKPVTFQATVVSEQTRQLVTETLQQASRVAETGNSSLPEVKEEPQSYTDSSSSSTESSQSSQDSQPVVHVIASRSQDWSEHEIAVDTSPTIIYQDVSSESQSATSTIKALLELQQTTVKEKLESKPRQPTIDLSQMAVPIQMTQEKRHSPESPSIAVVESELVAEYITTVSHRSQPHQQSSQPQRTLLQHVAQSQTATQTSVVVKSIPASSTGAITHIMQQALSSHTAFTKQSEQLGTEEGEVEEMDTLDPQTGLFYRSALTQSQAQKQQKLSQPQLEQTQLQVKTLQCFQTKQKQTIHLQADQIQHKLPQMPQLSIRHQKLTPLQQEQAQTKPDAQHPPHHMMAKERQLPTLVAQPQQTVVQVLAVKTTQQLPKLQQAPTAQKIYMQPQPPQSQMQLPASSEKQPASQHPIITQGSTVTKITFEGHQPPVPKVAGGSCVPKLALPRAVADILRMSMVVEAQIDTNVETVIVDPQIKAMSTSKPASEAESSPCTQVPRVAAVGMTATSIPQQQTCKESSSSPPAVGPTITERKLDAQGMPTTNQFIHIQNVSQKKAEESSSEIVIQTIPRYSIPCHSSSNVVVEPSGLLELNNFTSQRLDDEETAVEQDVDSSAEDGPEPSPSQSSAEQS
uniref:EMSY transcriptional repressor, BRCA2 interacting n=1 Tax=Pavo cristatus TaxID=9049 RepID=A0A8C9L994_PAVCR